MTSTHTEKSKGYRVLVVDDSATVRASLKALLKNHNYEVILAKDGLDALEVLKTNSGKIPDIILLDVEMPRMDGISFLEAIKHYNEYKHVPVIIFTSVQKNKFEKDISVFGPITCLDKECSEKVLCSTLETLLNTKGSSDA